MKHILRMLPQTIGKTLLIIISLLFFTSLPANAQADPCREIIGEIESLREQRRLVTRRLRTAPPALRPYLTQRNTDLASEIAKKERQLARCLDRNRETSSDPRESIAVWRAMLRIRTADVSDAGTDDDVMVELNANNLTWLDYGHDDFERGDHFSYDLLLKNVKNPQSRQSIRTLSDITRLKISKTGGNGLCLREIDLIINGRSIYREVFNAPGLWLDNEDGHSRSYTVPYEKLRRNSHWRVYTQPDMPRLMTSSEMQSRIESIIANYIHGTKLHWGHIHNGCAVEVTWKDNQTLRVDLDLAFAIGWPVPDPEVDIKFDIVISCSRGRISLTSQDYKATVDSRWYHEVISLGLIEWLDDKIQDGISGALRSITYTQNTGQPFCPSITVAHNGDIHLAIPPRP